MRLLRIRARVIEPTPSANAPSHIGPTGPGALTLFTRPSVPYLALHPCCRVSAPAHLHADPRTLSGRRENVPRCADASRAATHIVQAVPFVSRHLRVESHAVVTHFQTCAVVIYVKDKPAKVTARVSQCFAQGFTRNLQDVLCLFRTELLGCRGVHVDLETQRVRGAEAAHQIGQLSKQQ